MGSGAFWKYHDKLFASQTRPEGLQRENLEKLAAEAGVNMTRFRAALEYHRHKAAIEADVAAAADAGITGTPAFVINGYFVSGAQPYQRFKRLIDRALQEQRPAQPPAPGLR
jgi:predicted DsbA family dithiol-disulfide isomerase